MTKEVGISGFAAYVPPYRVGLQNWCEWTGSPWDKTSAVIGRSFRMRGPHQSVYTMAATAVMRLIDSYDIDPRRVGFLGLGTESSTDNSVGAVIVKGMLDEALRTRGLPPINRHCEVPELKHACLGGIYAMDPLQGDILWQFQTPAAMLMQPIVIGQSLYFGTADGALYAVNRFSGQTEWNIMLDAPMSGPLSFASGRLYAHTTDGRLNIIR